MPAKKENLPAKNSPVAKEPVVLGDWSEVSRLPASGPLCECGKPVADGQTSVCQDHIRSA